MARLRSGSRRAQSGATIPGCGNPQPPPVPIGLETPLPDRSTGRARSLHYHRRRASIRAADSRQPLDEIEVGGERAARLPEGPLEELQDLEAADRSLVIAIVELLAKVVAQLVRQHREELPTPSPNPREQRRWDLVVLAVRLL